MLGSMETFCKQTCFSCREMCLQVRETAFDAHGRKHEFQPAECRQFAWEDGTVQKVDNVSRTVLQVYRFLKCRFFFSLLSFWLRICMFKVNPRGVQLPFLNRFFARGQLIVQLCKTFCRNVVLWSTQHRYPAWQQFRQTVG